MDQSLLFSKGLTDTKTDALLKLYGPNEIAEVRKFTLLKSFLSQFDNVLTYLLMAAGGVSLLVGERVDSFFIFLIVILNALFGLYQEFKAEKALSQLKKLTVTIVRVIRNKKEQQIDSRLLVPGDIIYIDEGAKIPCDCTIIDSRHLEINEASLTGESLPVLKQDADAIFAGTVVAKGRAYAQVTKTGDATKFGQIAKTLSTIKTGKTPLQKKLEVFTKQVGFIGIIASLIVFILSFIQDKSLLESFLFAVSLAVAAVPEGLPAVMTITLAIGVERMAKKGAIVRKLNSIEALGSVTLVATDKTGTLTTNQMRVKKIFVDGAVFDSEKPPKSTDPAFLKLVMNGVLCSTASVVEKEDGEYEVIGDSTEGALLIMANRVGITPHLMKTDWQIIDEQPFDAVTKRMTVIVTNGKEKTVFTKGAPESILSICTHVLSKNVHVPLTKVRKVAIEKEFERFAKQGLRMIALSYKEHRGGHIESDQVFLGFVGIADPMRSGIREAVSKARNAGIKVVMITGDSPLTARVIATEAGIAEKGDTILTGQQLDEYSDTDLIPLLPKISIFARTSPQHKYRLVGLFQKLGEVVAVTGDGVNDALALKQADVGVAMGITGTDVAKETAHIILTDDNFATLIGAIEQGRNIFKHIKNAIKYLLACNMGEVIYIVTAVIFHLPVLTPLQILYMNLVTDGLPAIALAFSPNDGHVMKEKPRRVMTILDHIDYRYIMLIGVATAAFSYASIHSLIGVADALIISTVLFTTIIATQHFILADLWLSHKPILKNLRLLKKPIFIIGFLFPFLLHPFIIYIPFFQNVFSLSAMNYSHVGISLLSSLLIFIPIVAFRKQFVSLQKQN